jgi:hypothetical protein
MRVLEGRILVSMSAAQAAVAVAVRRRKIGERCTWRMECEKNLKQRGTEDGGIKELSLATRG